MNKKILVFGGMLLALLFVVSSALAQTDVVPSPTDTAATVTNTAAKAADIAAKKAVKAADVAARATAKAADVAAKIACVRSAIAVREAAMVVAIATHTDAVKAAQATRVNVLDGAYSNDTVTKLQLGVKVAWADFNRSTRAAVKAWKTNKNTIWTAFKTAVKACKAPTGVSDDTNLNSEF